MSAPAISPVVLSPRELQARRLALYCWCLLIIFAVLWEWRIAPLREGGSWLALKALPMLFVVPGLLRANKDSMQRALLLSFAYLLEALVRIMDPMPVRACAIVELLLVLAFMAGAIVYLRPYKRAAKAARSAT